MSRGFRFAHASNARLDAVPRDIGRVPDDLRETLRDATLSAFETLVTSCLEHEVNVLLLAGNTFDANDTSLRARAAFLDGLDCLDEAGITTIVVPGPEDPVDFWSRFGMLPESASVLGLDGATLPVLRDGETLLAVAESNARRSADDPFRIVATTSDLDFENGPRADYVALVGSGDRRTISEANPVAHHAGHTESRSRTQTGLGGMTIVDVDRDGRVRMSFQPTGTIHRERCNATFEAGESIDTAAERLVRCLRDELDSEGDHVRIVDWHVHAGHGWLVRHRDDLEEAFSLYWDDVANGSVLHRWTNDEVLDATGDDPARDALLEGIRSRSEADVAEVLHRVAATTDRSSAIESLVARLGRDVTAKGVARRAEVLATEWLGRAA